MSQSSVKTALGELTIIVLGVLIALFAESAWNDYQDRVEGRRYLARLAVEAKENLEVLGQDRSWAQYSCASARSAWSSLRDPEDEQDPAAFLRSAVLTSLYANPRYQRVTYDDLVGTGGLSLINDAILRAKIIAAYTEFFESLDAWRPPKDAPIRTVVIRTLPGEFVNSIATDCLEIQEPDSGAFTMKACSTAPVGATAENLVDSMKKTPDLEGYLLERAWQTCEFEEDMTFATELLEELVADLDAAIQ
jgi:hypothetical protein